MDNANMARAARMTTAARMTAENISVREPIVVAPGAEDHPYPTSCFT